MLTQIITNAQRCSIVEYCHWEIKMLEERKEMESAAPKPDWAGN